MTNLNFGISQPYYQNLKASKDLKCDNLLIINRDYSGEEEIEWFGIKGKVKFIPLWKWLLEQ